ncbi:MAG: phosphatidate cytidylyltransferase [Pseudomonadota bacterium]
MLRQRVFTAILMAVAFLLGVYWLSLPVLAALFALVIALGAWEWAPLAGLSHSLTRVLYVTAIIAGAFTLYAYAEFAVGPERERVQPILGAGCFWWCLALLGVRSYPSSSGIWNTMVLRACMGALVLLPAWFAAVYLLWLEPQGVFMIAMVLIVATADIGAYFTGRAFGRHALAPKVSPGKTWEGLWGGVVCVALLCVAVWSILPPRFDHLSLGVVLLVAMVTGLASVLGDLTVSMVKRVGGVKDSGSLLPGHGGILDRLDSLCAAAPTFALSLLLANF